MSLKDEIQAAQHALAAAVTAQDAQRASSLYTADASLMANGLPTFNGRAAVQGFFQQAYANGIARARFTTVEVDGGGDRATEIGEYSLFAAGPDGQSVCVEDGRYMIVWRKIDGAWQIFRDMFNVTGPRAQ